MAEAFVVEASLALDDGLDPRAVGAAVTVELCGHWEHDGPCRWPHHSAIDAERQPAAFETVCVADAGEAESIRARIEGALRAGEGWRVVEVGSRRLDPAQHELAARLLAGPRRPA